jgi:hypothetical protein
VKFFHLNPETFIFQQQHSKEGQLTPIRKVRPTIVERLALSKLLLERQEEATKN